MMMVDHDDFDDNNNDYDWIWIMMDDYVDGWWW